MRTIARRMEKLEKTVKSLPPPPCEHEFHFDLLTDEQKMDFVCWLFKHDKREEWPAFRRDLPESYFAGLLYLVFNGEYMPDDFDWRPWLAPFLASEGKSCES